MNLVDLNGPWSTIRRSPMVRIAPPFIAGLLLARGLHLVSETFLWITLAWTPVVGYVLLWRVPNSLRWLRGIATGAWFFLFGLCWFTVRSPRIHPSYVDETVVSIGPWLARVEAVNSTNEKFTRIDVWLIDRLDGDSVLGAYGKATITLQLAANDAPVRVGDRLFIDTELEPIQRIPDPGGFDGRTWASSRGIALGAFAASGRWKVVVHPWQWTDLFVHSRERISAWLNGSELPVRERALVKALVLGERDEIDYEMKAAFMRSGTIHVLAVSGMHVGLIFTVLSFALGWWGNGVRVRWMRGVLILLVLWGYAGLTGASPSALRATVMFTLFTLASMAQQRTDHLNSLFAAALVLLVWDPTMLWQASFQLSFLAVFGIIVFYRPLRDLWSPDSWVLRQVWALGVVSIAAQLLTTPVSLYLFKAFPMWFLPANIAVVTASSFAVYGGVLLILFYKVPLLGAALTWAMTMLLRFVGWAVDFFAYLPGAYPAVRIGMLEMLLIYLLMLALAAWWQWKWGSMRWLAFATAFALLGSWIHRVGLTDEQHAFVVYDQRDGFVAAMVNGRQLAVAASVDSFLVQPRILDKFDKHMRSEGLDELVPVGVDAIAGRADERGGTLFGQGRWMSTGADVLFVSKGTSERLRGNDRFDAIVLHDLRHVEDELAQRLNSMTDRVVVAGGIPWRTRSFLRDWCAAHHLFCHDVRDQGAFILEK